VTVWPPTGPFFGTGSTEDIRKKQALYQIMDYQHDNWPKYQQFWGKSAPATTNLPQ
jgi:hypothetical protein